MPDETPASLTSEIGKCPDCGGAIWLGHVTHRCPEVVMESDEGAFTVSVSTSFDLICIPRQTLAKKDDESA